MHRYCKITTKPTTWYRGSSQAYTVSMYSGRYSTKGHQKYRISIPLGLFIRDVLKLESKGLAIKSLLRRKTVSVNGKAITTHRYPLAVLDILAVNSKFYRVLLKKRFYYQEVTEPILYLRVIKSIRRSPKDGKGGYQVNCLDGHNFLSDRRIEAGYTAKYHTIEKTVVYLQPSALPTFCVIKGRYKGSVASVRDSNLTDKQVSLNGGTVSIDNCLFYE